MNFELISEYTPTGDQPQAIRSLTNLLRKNVKEQVLLGVTGSGKTFTMANVIAEIGLPVLVISHNKTLAAQLYQEFRSFFPKNAVSYFVSYYDYYQPEAYIPQTDTYIEKETNINEEIDKLRLQATTNLLTRPDTIIVASVSSIYNIGSPKEYGRFILELRVNMEISRAQIFTRLVELQYERSDYGFTRGTFRVRGNLIDIFPAYEDYGIHLDLEGTHILSITQINPVSSQTLDKLTQFVLYPAKHYMTDVKRNQSVFARIEADLQKQVELFKSKSKIVEAYRLEQKVHYDLEMIQTVGYVNGIENYSRYFDGRTPGDPPFTLFDYYHEKYGEQWLLFIDESHMTIPQLRGMHQGDQARKKTLIDFGFRLPAALDNRPLNFSELMRRIPYTVYVSATPDDWEISRVKENVKAKSIPGNGVTEQLVRPTGLVDPIITVKPSKNQISDVLTEIEKRVSRKERVLITTLTKRMAEDLSSFLEERGIKVHYLHSDIVTLERTDILDNLRSGKYDVLVGINLLREGLDLPEVSLVAILDADKEGFLRSRVSLVQTMGRAARHVRGEVIMYADTETQSIQRAIYEVKRRREIQLDYNKKHDITPQSITKPIREKLVDVIESMDEQKTGYVSHIDESYIKSLTPYDKNQLIKKLEKAMRQEAEQLNFEVATEIRDQILKLKSD